MTYIDLQECWNDENDFMVCHTSGSTGRPKEISLKKSFMIQSAMRTINKFGLTSESHLHSCISPDFIGGKMMWIRANILGCKFTFEQPTNHPLLNYSSDDPFDLVAVVPSQMLYICENFERMPDVRCFLVGGAPVNKHLANLIESRKINAYESYGMTETSSHIAVRKISTGKTPFSLLDGISIGEEDGCLSIKIPDCEPIITNDLVEIISEKEFFITGRRDNMLISGGRKLQPEIIEEILSKFFHIPLAVCAMEDNKWGEKAVCLFESKDSDTFKHILYAEYRHIMESMPGYMLPKEFIGIERIPRTGSGKILHERLTREKLDSMHISCRIDPKSLQHQNIFLKK